MNIENTFSSFSKYNKNQANVKVIRCRESCDKENIFHILKYHIQIKVDLRLSVRRIPTILYYRGRSIALVYIDKDRRRRCHTMGKKKIYGKMFTGS